MFKQKVDTAHSGIASATITVSAEATDVRTLTVQVTDALGASIAQQVLLDVIVYTTAAATALATTGGSTGIASTAGVTIVTVTAKKVFKMQTTAAGLLTLTWTDTGTESVAVGVWLPNGKLIITAAFANA
tara:strand:+ start:340 stop:729 length:390 start_codon:yes stop_codon:yes gene_type:complete